MTSSAGAVAALNALFPLVDDIEGGRLMDWNTLLTPLIIALVPITVALGKRFIPARYAVLFPVIATTLGPVFDYLSTYLSAQPASPGRGILMGMAGVALREIVDQLRKVPTGPAVP